MKNNKNKTDDAHHYSNISSLKDDANDSRRALETAAFFNLGNNVEIFDNFIGAYRK